MACYQRIRDLREDDDKTQSEIASYLGTTAQYYGKYEKGEREIPFSRAIQLAEYYNVSLDYIAGRTHSKNGFPQNDMLSICKGIIDIYLSLTEKNKGKLELFAEQLLERQEGI